MISILPIPICTIVNLKKGYGGRTRVATMKPIIEPDIEPRTTFAGINHLQKGKFLSMRKFFTHCVITYSNQENKAFDSNHCIIFSKVIACPS